MFSGRKKLHEILLMLPSTVWLILFFVIPFIIVFLMAFKPSDIYGNVEEGWTLRNLTALASWEAFPLIWRTLWISFIATAITVVVAIPVGYYLSTVKKRYRSLILLAIILPFWTSFLVRIFAWKSILHPEGFLKDLFVFLHIVEPQTSLLYNVTIVIFMMVCTYLPFAILPIYAAASKFDFSLLEAALDLGATRRTAFFRVFLPAIGKGILNATIIVFIPILGAYVIPDVVGGVDSEMVGNRIGQKILLERNMPGASALGVVLALGVLIPMLLGFILHSRSKKLQVEMRNVE